MKLCIINGSPKGKYSITLQTVLYLQEKFPEHQFTYLHAGQKIKAYEKDIAPAVEQMKAADVLVFAYPVYTFLAPSQLHRFIELIKASGVNLSGKFASQISTSKHFYDVTAHRYISDNCHDLGLRVVHGLSADMEDLLTEQGRHEAESFFRYLEYCARRGICEPVPGGKKKMVVCEPERMDEGKKEADRLAWQKINKRNFENEQKEEMKYNTVIVADVKEDDTILQGIIRDFTEVYPYPVRVVNIAEYPFSGGCLGCFSCAGDGKCIYKDDFDRFLRDEIQTADAVVYAFTIKDHCMGARFKMYDDRQFCNGHRTVTEGMPFAYLVSGDYENEPNLRMVIEARCEVGHNFLGGVAYDADSLCKTAERLAYAVREHYVQPRNFYGVGGMKIFRDLIWLMRGIMKADHVFYKKHGIYDFPQRRRGYMIKMSFLGSLLRNPKVKAKMGNKMNEGMIAPYQKIIQQVK